METRNSTMLETSGEDCMLIETVKNMVTQKACNESASEPQDFFLVPQIRNEQFASETNAEQVAGDKHQAWPDLCRICANVDDHLIPIFEGEGAEHDLSNKIVKYLPIHISESDTLPLQLCYHCAATLLAWHDLSEGCLKAERHLLEMRDKHLRHKHQYYNAISLDNLQVSTPVAATTIASNVAISQRDEQPRDKNGIHVAEGANRSNRSCDVRTPFRVFLDTQNIFWKPYRKRCAEPMHESKTSAAEDCDSVWIAVMDTTLDQPLAVAEQLRDNDSLRFPAVQAKEVAAQHSVTDSGQKRESCRLTDLAREDTGERDRISDDDSPCPEDSTGGNKKQQREPGKSHRQCAECGKCFKLKDSYLRHMRIHNDERPFTCHVCGKQFRDSGGLSRHLRDVHAKLKNFMCDLCGRSFASKATRDDHRRTHTGERPYICDSCGKTFKSKASLYIHSKLHTDEFPHACSYCAKRFRRRQEMLAHITTHTGEKNHTCDVCAKKFRIKSELARHKLIHSENKPFVCMKCGLAFRQKRYLNNHVKSRHKEQSALRTR